MTLACFQERFRLTTKQTQLYAAVDRDGAIEVGMIG